MKHVDVKSCKNILYVNAQSLHSNIDGVRKLLIDKKPMILMVSETCLTESIEDCEIECDGYVAYRNDSTSRHTGGCCIYVSSILNSNLLQSKTIEMTSWLLSIKVNALLGKETIFTVVYNSPSASKRKCLEFFELWCSDIDLDKNYVVTGDFNVDLLKNDCYSKKLCDIINSTGMKQFVKEPTRITERSRTLIDLVISNCVNSASVLPDDKVTDHETIVVDSNLFSKVKEPRAFVEKIVNYTADAMISKLKCYNWSNLSTLSLNEKSETLVNRLKHCVSEFVEIVEVKHANEIKWFDKDLLYLKKKRDVTYRIAVILDTAVYWKRYKCARNKYTANLKLKKKVYFEGKLTAASGDSKATWKILKKLLNGKKCRDIKNVEINGVNESDPKVICEKLNRFFVDTIDTINRSIAAPLHPVVTTNERKASVIPEFQLKNASRNHIITVLKTLKNKSDTDKISPSILLDSMDLIGQTVQEIVNESFMYDEIPKCFKVTTVCPAPKVSRPTTAEEYRPINMLITLDKLLESIVKMQLLDHIEKYNLLSQWQSGYRKNHSCETALNVVVANWKELVDEGSSILCVFLDLKRAFETVDRKRMIEKLKTFGVGQKTRNWFENFLGNRFQRTTVNGYTSSNLLNDIGLPQGSVLSAILFIIYINDMPDHLKNVFVNLFADDTLLYCVGNNKQDMANQMNAELAVLNDWLATNKLKLNTAKTKWMLINNKTEECNETVKLKILDAELGRVDFFKYLGFIIDNKMNMKEHVSYTCKKIAKKIFCFGRLAKYMTFRTKITVYKSIIQPHFDYCVSMLLGCNKEDIEKLQVLQNRALRIILKCKRRTRVAKMLESLRRWNIKSVQQSIIAGTLKMVFKVKNNLVPTYLTERVKLNNEVHSYNLRNAADFRLSKYKKLNTQKMLLYEGLKLYNSLPIEIKCERNLNLFKKKSDNYVFENIQIE